MVRYGRDHAEDIVLVKEYEMDLIDKYIAEIGRYLPRKNRVDIEAEIRSTLEDMLEERRQAKGGRNQSNEAEEMMVIDLLKEYGSPQAVASSYQTHQHQYLIGPRLFPIFTLVSRVVFTVLIVLSLIGLGTELFKAGFTSTGIFSSVGEWLTSTLSGLMTAFGYIVLVLMIIDRTTFGRNFEKETEEWDPRELYSAPDPDQIDPPDHIFTLIFTFLGLAILNLYPNLISIRFLNDNTWTSVPIFTETFFRFLPWINIMGLLQIGFNGYMLSQREWRTPVRILSIVMDIAQAILFVSILKTPGIFGITPEALTALGITESAEDLSRLVNSIPIIILAIVVVVTIIKVVQSSMRLFKDKSKAPYPVLK
jgi:hypothetical protein